MHKAVKTFRTIFVEGRFTSVLASFVIIGMRILLFLKNGIPESAFQNNNYLWNYLLNFFAKPEISFVASTISVFIIAWIIFIMNNRFGLIRTRSNLPFIVPLFLLSLHPYFLIMTGDYIAIIFILLSFFPLLESYQKPNSYLYSFRSSVLLATASIFQVFAITLIPLIWRGERSMRGPQLRSLMSSLFGAFLVYITLFSIYFIYDDLSGFLMPLKSLALFAIPQIPDYNIIEWLMLLFILLFFVLNMVFSINIYGRDKVLTLNFMQFIVFLIVILLLLQIAFWKQTFFFLALSVTLIAYLSSYFYTRNSYRNHVYLAYFMITVMFVMYLSHLFPILDSLV